MRARGMLALAVLGVTLVGCGAVKFQYKDRQLGARTWEVRSTAVWPGAAPDLRRFVLYRAAELTRAFGYRYFAVRAYSGDAAEHRYFPVNGPRRDSGPSPFPAVTEESEEAAVRARNRYLSTGTDARVHEQYVKFRILDTAEIGDGSEAVDAERVLRELQAFINRRR